MKKILSIIPLFSVYILTIALFKVYVFYNSFNVPIKFFISVSELTIIIFEDLLYIFPPLILLYILTDKTNPKYDINEFSNKIRNTLVIKLKDKNFKEIVTLLSEKIFIYIMILIYFLLFIGFPIFLIIFHRNYSEKIGGYTFLGVIILILIFITKSKKIIKMITLEGMILSTILLIFSFFFVLKILADIQETEKGKYVGTKVITEDSTYISTNNNYYIGQTSNYVFIFNKKQNQSTIIPVSNIKRIELLIKE